MTDRDNDYDFARPSADELAAAAEISASTMHEAAGKVGALPAAIKPLDPKARVCGPAFTVKGPPGDNLWLHFALAHARPGDVLVADVGGHYEMGYWGEVMTVSAQARGLGGLVINGCVRDGQAMVELGFPVFARGLSMRGTEKDRNYKGRLAEPLPIGDVLVMPGDLVLGDGDGVAVIPRGEVGAAITASRERDEREARLMAELRTGKTTVEIYGW